MTFRLFVAGLAAFCILLSYVAEHLTIEREWDFRTSESPEGILVASADYVVTMRAAHKGVIYRVVGPSADGTVMEGVDYAGKIHRLQTMHRFVGWRQGDDVRRLFAL